MKRVSLIVALVVSGCGGGATEPPTPTPSPTCDELELALPDGSCFRPGVPPDGCAEGFLHDGEYGCEPILPDAACPTGLMAVPGDEVCRPVMDCGRGTWGELPVDATTQYVDGSYAGGDGDGSEAKPWTTVVQGVTAAEAGALVAVAAGTYAENVLISGKSVRLWGVCPEQVEIVATGIPAVPCGNAALCIVGDAAGGTEVGGVGLSGSGFGIQMSGVQDVLLDRIRVFDNQEAGVLAQPTLGATSTHLRGALIEGNNAIGLFVSGSVATLEASVVRTTLPRTSDNSIGRGVVVQLACVVTPTEQCDPAARSTAIVRGSLIADNHEYGMFVMGSDVSVDATVVRGTLPSAATLTFGQGINIQMACVGTGASQLCDPAARSVGTVSRSVVEQNHNVGLLLYASDVEVNASVVRDTLPRAADQGAGRGIGAEAACVVTSTGPQCDPAAAANMTLRQSLIDANHDIGVYSMGSSATLDASVVRATLGRGASIQIACLGTPTGLQCEPNARSTGSIARSLIDDNSDIGVFVIGSDATFANSVVRATAVRASDGLFGDGVAVLKFWAPASATIVDSVIIDSARAGVSSFGGFVSFADSRILCAAFSLVGEPRAGSEAEVDNGGNNLCGCPNADSDCKLVSAGLAPPEAPPLSD
jgi:hypothetical protein